MCCYNGDKSQYRNSEICSAMSFSSNREAEDVVDGILKHVGLKRNFIIMECPNIKNAIAVNLPGELGQIRYIIYDNDFMDDINLKSNTNWSAISILAHEVGHHLNAHTLSKAGNSHKNELEADEFSGFILAKMGATLTQAQAAINSLTNMTASSTHPGKYKRLEAIEIGYKSAQSNGSNARNNSVHDNSLSVNKKISNRIEDKTPVYSYSPLLKYANRTISGGQAKKLIEDGYVEFIQNYNDDFVLVSDNGVQGYLWRGWLKSNNKTYSSPPNRTKRKTKSSQQRTKSNIFYIGSYYTAINAAPIRLKPDYNSQVVTTFSDDGSEVKIISKYNLIWYRVRYKNKEGYLRNIWLIK